MPAPAPPPGTDTTPAPAPSPAAPQPGSGSEQERGGSKKPADDDGAGKKKKSKGKSKSKAEVELESGAEDRKGRKGKRKKAADGIRNPDGSPTPSNPGFMDALPGPSTASGVPNFVIRKFRVPVFLLPIYQAAGIQYGVRWEVLAAINEIETDYGRNLNVSSAGALGWMQFIPSSWRAYGVDANKDGKKDPYNPVDAIFAAARYLKAAGYEQDVRRSIFAYNHADWYVDSVMLRARLISGVPADLVGSLTGLTEGRFPVAARARYADDLQEAEATKRVKRGQNAANVVESKDNRENIDIFAKQGAPGGVHQRRRDQEDRGLQGPGPLHHAPGRVRQPLHLQRPGLHRQVLPRPQGGRGRPEAERPRRQGQRRRQGPQAHRARPPPAASPPRPATSARRPSCA